MTTLDNQEEETVTPIQGATFLVHVKEHGLTYAVVLLVAQQVGLLGEVTTLLGGMC